jgi:phosphohistidine phosphatase
MAKQLWLLRHGEAVPHGARPDSERELTPKGVNQARLAGRGLAKVGIEFDGCYSSPKVRARDTARLACEELGRSFDEVSALAGGFEVDDVKALLLEHDDGARVLVVGHEPDFSQVVYDLSGARIDMKKGGVAALRVSGGAGELIALLRPAELEAMAG